MQSRPISKHGGICPVVEVKITLQQAIRAQKGGSTHTWPRRLNGVGGQSHFPAALSKGEKSRTHSTGGWAALEVHLDGQGEILRPMGLKNPDRPARSDPTMLS
jgi:hypothetical protein